MKIAVCISGAPRAYPLLAHFSDSTRKRCIDGWDADVYCSFWEGPDSENLCRYFGAKQQEILPEPTVELANDVYARWLAITVLKGERVRQPTFNVPMEEWFRNWVDGGPLAKRHWSIPNMLKMFYLINRSHTMALNSGKEYDIYVRLRPDHQVLRFQGYEINEFLNTSNRDKGAHRRATDTFAFGNKSVMSVFSGVWDTLPQMMETLAGCIKSSDPESFVNRQLQAHDIPIKYLGPYMQARYIRPRNLQRPPGEEQFAFVEPHD